MSGARPTAPIVSTFINAFRLFENDARSAPSMAMGELEFEDMTTTEGFFEQISRLPCMPRFL